MFHGFIGTRSHSFWELIARASISGEAFCDGKTKRYAFDNAHRDLFYLISYRCILVKTNDILKLKFALVFLSRFKLLINDSQRYRINPWMTIAKQLMNLVNEL